MHEREQLELAIAQLEAQRATLGDGVVDASVAALREKLATLTRVSEQRKQVTILFADVIGYTAMSETMDAEEVSEVINALWQRMDG
ncbi:MAG: adenylate/guanylate cyclase domain-containing protein, partial [Anaerolineae bacterium]